MGERALPLSTRPTTTLLASYPLYLSVSRSSSRPCQHLEFRERNILHIFSTGAPVEYGYMPCHGSTISRTLELLAKGSFKARRIFG